MSSRRVQLLAAFLLLSGCAGRSNDAGLVGLWQPDPKSGSPITRLTLAADHTFHAVGWSIQFVCKRAVYAEPASATNMWATGHWTYDAENLRLALRYDQPADRRCEAPALTPLVVDPAMGETDLLVYPEGLDHKDSRIRLRQNIHPTLRTSSPAAATNQVECFRERARWEQACGQRAYRCVTHYSDAGKACTDNSQCEGRCLVDLSETCTPAEGCRTRPIPEVDGPFVGRCEANDIGCGSFMQIRKGRAEPIYSVD